MAHLYTNQMLSSRQEYTTPNVAQCLDSFQQWDLSCVPGTLNLERCFKSEAQRHSRADGGQRLEFRSHSQISGDVNGKSIPGNQKFCTAPEH